MSGVTLRIVGVERLARDLDELSRHTWKMRLRVVVGKLVRAAIAQYPPPPTYPLRWASPKQKRWFFSQVREGNIEVPYVRQFALTSQRLGWTTVQEGEKVFVGTRVTYAPYVQSAEKQQPFHANTGWKTDQQAVDEVARSGDIDRAAKDLMDKLLKR